MDLQKSMIIQKQAKELPLVLTLKSIVMMLVTWSLWGYSMYIMYFYAKKIFVIPVFEELFFHQILAWLFIGSAALLLITIIWSFIATPSRYFNRRKSIKNTDK